MSATTKPQIPRALQLALNHGCDWHGKIASDGCCECSMIAWWRVELAKPDGARP